VLYLPFSSQNHPPVADAGPDLTVNENRVILLNNGKGSDSDPEDTLIYKWTQIGGSPFVRFSNDNTTLTLQLSVTDNHGLNDTDTMNVLVKNIPPPTPPPPTPTPPPPLAPPELEEEEEAEEEDAAAEAEDAAEDAADEAEDAADEAEDAAAEAEEE
ncbi:MAG: Peptidase, (Fungalysin) family, partial [Nitrososphaeraceae archaeon]|nr:Peptidase, (Fungalysin) family [Nitrososphaeraceae archaeon]